MTTLDTSPFGLLEQARIELGLKDHDSTFRRLCEMRRLKVLTIEARLNEFRADPSILPNAVHKAALEVIFGPPTS